MNPAKPRRRRRFLAQLVTLAVVLASAHSVAWLWATEEMLVRAAGWAEQRRAEGWTVEHAAPLRGGWPLRAEVTLPAVRVEGPAGPQADPVGLDAVRIVLRVGPPHLDRLVIAMEGPQVLRLGAVALPMDAARLEARIRLGTGPRDVVLFAEELNVLTPQGAATMQRLHALVAPNMEEAALGIEWTAEGVRPPPQAVGPAAAALGPEIAMVALRGALTGPPPGPPSAAQARAWRDAGGRFDVQGAMLHWGPVVAEGSFLLGLDAALQPAGSGALRVAGAPAAIEAMAAAGMLPPATARAAQGIATLLSRTPPEGGPPRIEAPVAIANGRISVAGLPLVAIAPLVWP